MKLAMPSFKKIILILVGLIVVGLLFLWQALPRILQSQAEKFVADKTGHKLVMDRPEFNPFQLALRIGKLQLNEPDGKPLFGFDSLLVDLSAASITSRALVFDAIRLDGPDVTVVELPEGKINWTPFIDALKSKEEKPEEKQSLPRLDIRSLILAGGKVDFADRRGLGAGFATRIEPLDLELSNLSTLPDKDGKFDVSAVTALGARVDLVGKVDLDPIAVSGTLTLADLQLVKLAPYLKEALPVPPEGVLGLSARYQAGSNGDKFDATVEQIEATLTGLRLALKDVAGPVAGIDSIQLKNGRFQLASQELAIGSIIVNGGKLSLPQIENPPQFATLTVEDLRVALAERNASVGSLRLADGRVYAVRTAAGAIDLLEALRALSSGKPDQIADAKSGDTPPAPPWRFKLDKVAVSNLGVVLQEASVKPALELALDNMQLQVNGVSNDMTLPLSLQLAFDVRSGGHFEGEGKVVPAIPTADVNFKLIDLSLKPAQPFLSQQTTLTLAEGKLSTQGRALYGDKGPNVKGEFAVRDLRLMEPGSDRPLLAWKLLGSRDLSFTPQLLNLGELRLNGLNTRLLIEKDKSINFKRVMKSSGEAKTAPAAAEPVAKPAEKPAPPTFIVNIDRLRFAKGEMDFADLSLILPFGTRIHDLQGSIAGLSNRPGARGADRARRPGR